MFTKRTIILNSVEHDLHKAVISLERTGEQLKGSVKLYNFKEEPKGVLTLGILCDGEVYKAGLNRIALNQYQFNTYIKNEIKDFTCALVNSYNGEIKPLLIGASNGASSQSAEIRLASSLGALQKKSMDAVKKILDDNQIDLEEDTEQLINDEISKNCDENCFLCPYKKAFYSDNNIDEEKNVENQACCSVKNIEEKYEKDNENLENNSNFEENNEKFEEKDEINEDKLSFYDEIKEQLGMLFTKYDEAKDLEDIIPNSKFVRIEYDDSGLFYVLGLIYENEQIKYVCYGVPGIYSDECPQELKGLSQWLPLDEGQPQGKGYWLSYQDAQNGENIKIEVV